MNQFKFRRTFFIIFLFSAGMLLVISRCMEKSGREETSKNTYVGEEKCAACHTAVFKDWKTSDHKMAMQPANDSTVAGDFNNVTFMADGVTSRFFKVGHTFMINTEGEDGKNHDYEVKYTFGYQPLQQYLVEFPGGRLQVPRVSWDVKKKQWFHQYAGQQIQAHDWLHWTGNSQNWNTMCASCHSTHLQKKYDLATDTYHTTYDRMNVSCESCHGPGKRHIDYIGSKQYKNQEKTEGAFILLNRKSSQTTQINTCAPCHARITHLNDDPDPAAAEIMDNYIPEIPTDEFFHADGQVDSEDYIYTSFLQSKMYKRGVKCSDCHNPHSGRMIFTGNDVCQKCHAPSYNQPTHTFHVTGTEGAKCVNCHMPGKVYMGNDLRHDHSFRVPRPDQSVAYNTPNACNGCHVNKSAQWAADAVVKWYGPTRKPNYSDKLIPGSKLGPDSEPNLIALLNDDFVNAIIKAAAAHYLGNIQTVSSMQALLQSLKAADAQIRYRALVSLTDFPPEYWKNEVGPLLSDKVRAVRIASAQLYAALPAVPKAYTSSYLTAKKELEAYLLYQADFATGNILIADYYLKQADYSGAEKFYLRGLKMDNQLNYARFNLSTIYNIKGNNSKALSTLLEAEKTDPANDRVYYNLALLYNEMKDRTASAKAFEKAVALKSANPKVYYNYGLLLNEQKKYTKAASILQKGITLNPDNAEIYYVLALVYLSDGKKESAQKAAIKLKQLAPYNQEYTPLYKQLGI